MRYAQIRQYDVANGPGIRVSVFVTGCSHACPGCFNQAYQDFSYGQTWTEETTEELISYLDKVEIAGLTLLGGEPMQNLELAQVVRKVRQKVDKPIWIYSGYTYEQIVEDPEKKVLLDQCDVLVDGLFKASLKDLRLKFRGSSNQRLIDLKASKREGRLVELQI